MANYTYENPAEIDGDPSDVREVAIAQLEGITQLVDEIAGQTGKQVLNAALSDVLKKDREADADDLNQLAVELRPKELILMGKVREQATELARLARLLEQARREYDE